MNVRTVGRTFVHRARQTHPQCRRNGFFSNASRTRRLAVEQGMKVAEDEAAQTGRTRGEAQAGSQVGQCGY